ncbi:jacalin-like lectin [Novosphingobium beihaiensis]|uniref:Jacalin-type lectin domain-containing protein n=1 Tax=Novosphingobium beihaiensis TaxID=2930389 RepID=A0ABT0BPH9_9SPHN|nr:hypothetical protein [Novosphingobium beihaiensis]MCJ2186965.1 hypothetical protein [Novosphingobium beihaiensis]
MGFDSVLGQLRSNTAIEFETIAGGSAVQLKAVTCSSMEEMGTALEINQSLSAGFAKFGKVDQKLEFATQQKVTTQSVQVVVYAKNVTRTVSVKDVSLKRGVQDEGLAEFFRIYGDSYISYAEYGGEFYAVYTFFTQTREEQTRIAAEVNTIVNRGVVDVSASIQTEFNSFLKSTETSWEVQYDLRGMGKTPLPDKAEIFDFALTIPNIPVADEDRVVLGTESSGYDDAAGLTLDLTQVKDNRAYFLGDYATGGLAADVIALQARRNGADWLEQIYGTYAIELPAELQNYIASIETGTTKAMEQYDAYSRNPLQAFTRPDLPVLEQTPPVLFVLQPNPFPPQWGGGGGGYWGYGNIEDAVINRRRLDYIYVRGGSNIDRIALKYKSFLGGEPDAASETHGAKDGNIHREMTIQPGDAVKTVKVTHSDWLHYLEIVTKETNGITVGSPGSRTVRSLTVPEGAAFLGFQGRSGDRIDRLQVIYAELKLKW